MLKIPSSPEKAEGAVDTHGAREQWICVFVYKVDTDSELAINRSPMTWNSPRCISEKLRSMISRKTSRGELGTRTATLHKDGIKKLQGYLDIQALGLLLVLNAVSFGMDVQASLKKSMSFSIPMLL